MAVGVAGIGQGVMETLRAGIPPTRAILHDTLCPMRRFDQIQIVPHHAVVITGYVFENAQHCGACCVLC